MPCSRTVTATGSGRSLARRARQAHPVSSHSPQHVCSLCKKHFTTSGHLKRHVEIHSGSRNFPCPIPGCETRCSRADNLQQQCVLPIKTHSASYVPRKAPKRDTKRNRARGKAAAVPSPTQLEVDPFSFPALYPYPYPARPRPSTTRPPGRRTRSRPPSSPRRQLPHPPLRMRFQVPSPHPFSFPMDFQPEIHVPVPGLALLSLEPAVELFRPKRLLVDTNLNFDAVQVVAGQSPSSAASPHSHRVLRCSIYNWTMPAAAATLRLVSPSTTSESDGQSLVSVGASMDMDAPGCPCFYPFSGASSEWPAAMHMHMAASATATYDMEAYLAGLAAYPASVSSASAMIHAHTGPGDPGHGLSMPLPGTSYAYAQQQQHQFQ
ncbi:hypothetical protein HMN09_00456600 [Mycena chlorophos]|uniref:C2H2-type domain-containing protein n=1 Tax=Mycena chlorophos TaxID=658473 RepID=A0A8H6TIB6_MYCCL|nr:hypothetical protein HMN09_00456600 [Mycena chlorophos]